MSKKVNLNDKHLIVLWAACQCGGYFIDQISELTGLIDDTVRSLLDEMIEFGVIQRRAFLDVRRLGYVVTRYYLELNQFGQSKRGLILEFLKHHKSVSYLTAYNDGKTLQIGVVADDHHESRYVFEEMIDKFGETIESLEFHIMDEMHDFGVNLLGMKAKHPRVLSFKNHGSDGKCLRLRVKHRDMLSTLSGWHYKHKKELAKKIGRTPSHVTTTTNALKALYIYLGDRFVMDTPKTNFHAKTLLVNSPNICKSFQRRLIEYVENEPALHYIAVLMGEWRFEIGLTTKTEHEGNSAIDKLKSHFQNEISEFSEFQMEDFVKVAQHPF